MTASFREKAFAPVYGANKAIVNRRVSLPRKLRSPTGSLHSVPRHGNQAGTDGASAVGQVDLACCISTRTLTSRHRPARFTDLAESSGPVVLPIDLHRVPALL